MSARSSVPSAAVEGISPQIELANKGTVNPQRLAQARTSIHALLLRVCVVFAVAFNVAGMSSLSTASYCGSGGGRGIPRFTELVF